MSSNVAFKGFSVQSGSLPFWKNEPVERHSGARQRQTRGQDLRGLAVALRVTLSLTDEDPRHFLARLSPLEVSLDVAFRVSARVMNGCLIPLHRTLPMQRATIFGWKRFPAGPRRRAMKDIYLLAVFVVLVVGTAAY